MSSTYRPRPCSRRASSRRGIAWPIQRCSVGAVMRIPFDSVDDRLVASAAAQIAADSVTDILPRRGIVCFEQCQRRQQHSRSAEAALQAMAVSKRLLKRMQAARLRNAIDGDDMRTM